MNLFKMLTKEEIKKYTYTKSYKTNEIIFNAGDECNIIGYLEKGEASIITITHTEKEETITYLNEGSFFGDLLIFSTNNIYLGHCICKKDAVIRYISKNNLLLLFQNNYYMTNFLTHISNKAQEIKKENKILKHNNLEDRIIHFLLEEKIKTSSNIIKIQNITTLSKILSVPRPSVSRILTKIKQDNLIEIKKVGQMCYIKLLIEY